MLISILVFSFNSAAGLASSYDLTIAEAEIQKFNSNFEKNIEGDVEIQNIITMVYFAKDYNTKNLFAQNDTRYISIVLERKELTEKKDSELINIMTSDEYLFDNQKDKTKHQKYQCNIEYNDEGRVQKVVCTKK